MNREIKFRLHDQEGNIIGYEIHEKNEYGCWQIYHTSLRGDWKDNNVNRLVIDGYFIAAKTKCEYTGLKDKNYKEIYEGDILKSNYSLPLVVVFEDGKFCFCNSHSSGSDVLSQMRVEKLDIIGNTFQNPELLK